MTYIVLISGKLIAKVLNSVHTYTFSVRFLSIKYSFWKIVFRLFYTLLFFIPLYSWLFSGFLLPSGRLCSVEYYTLSPVPCYSKYRGKTDNALRFLRAQNTRKNKRLCLSSSAPKNNIIIHIVLTNSVSQNSFNRRSAHTRSSSTIYYRIDRLYIRYKTGNSLSLDDVPTRGWSVYVHTGNSTNTRA